MDAMSNKVKNFLQIQKNNGQELPDAIKNCPAIDDNSTYYKDAIEHSKTMILETMDKLTDAIDNKKGYEDIAKHLRRMDVITMTLRAMIIEGYGNIKNKNTSQLPRHE